MNKLTLDFFGDLATPHKDKIITNVEYNNKSYTFFNLEGSIGEGGKGLYNNPNIINFLKQSNTIAVSIANNHIFDNGINKFNSTIQKLKENNIKYIGSNTKPLEIINFNDNSIAIITAGWSLIGCKSNGKVHINQLNKKKLLLQVKEAKKTTDNIVFYAHWNYELELYPQPQQRELARELIDSGVSLVIGCHSHCVQGYEVYNGKYIFYGLGNFYIEPGFYYNKMLKFPEFTKTGLAIRYNIETREVLIGITQQLENKVNISNFIHPYESELLHNLSTSFKLSGKKYETWFKYNRRKKILLPIFKENESLYSQFYKSIWVYFRGILIKGLTLLNLKSSPS
jgi:Putative enzyme of poly-gamma-glutamate biosynthesis (capsule formation)